MRLFFGGHLVKTKFGRVLGRFGLLNNYRGLIVKSNRYKCVVCNYG